MKRTLSMDCKEKVGKEVLVKGWMHQLRQLGKINFLILRDRKGFIQIVVEEKKELGKIQNLQVGSILYINAKVKASKQAEAGVELVDPKIEVVGPITEVPPVEYNKDDVKADLPTILDYRPVTARNKKINAIFRVQETILRAFRESMRDQGFTEFSSPVLMKTPSESGAEVFEVKYFDRKAYLCQSPQFYKQIMVGVFERAFTISKAFRAEKHHTSRHLTEITQMDGEMGFVEDMDEVHEVCENVVRHIFSSIDKNNKKELKMWNVTLPKLPKGRFPKIKVKEALKIIEEKTGKSADRKLDLADEDERVIGKWAKEKYGTDLIWVTHYFKDKNPYTWNDPKSKDESLSYDLLCRGIEWLTGTVRIEKYEKLVENLKKQGANLKNYEGYLQAFKYGMPPEAGFSFGLERITQKVFDFKNIREATLFPRDVERLTP